MRDAFICDGVRTPVGRYGGGVSPGRAGGLGAITLRALLGRHPQPGPGRGDDVNFGAANPGGGEEGRPGAFWGPFWGFFPPPNQRCGGEE